MQKLIEALKTIKFECEKHERCCDCPMSDGYDDCEINNQNPFDWKIIDINNIKKVFE